MKLTDFSEEQLRTERLVHGNMPCKTYYKWNDRFGWERYMPDNCCTNNTISPEMLSKDTWQIYKPELKLEKGKYYKDARGNTYECISTRNRKCDDYCIVQNVNTGGTMCLYPNGTYLRNNNSACDLIEEVPAPKEPA